MIATWLVVLVAVAGIGTAFRGKVTSEFSVPGIESQQAQDLLKDKFPAAAGGVARVVFAAPQGQTLTKERARRAISTSLQQASHVPGVLAVADPATTGTMSANRTVAYADVRFRQAPEDVPQSAKDALSRAMAPVRAAGIHVEFSGSAETAATQVEGPAEIVGLVVAFIVLALALGSLIAAGLPLLTAAVGVVIGVLGVGFTSRFIQMTGTATVLALMIGLAVGIDYALFIISRHREHLADPAVDVHDSIARAVATAGSAVVFAGATVIAALAALFATGIPFLTVMGLAAAVTVLLAVLVALTLVPAALAVAGERLRPRRSRRTEHRQRAADNQEAGRWARSWARTVTRAPLVVLLVGVVGLLALAVPARDLRLGLPSNAEQPAASTQHRSYDLLTQGFGPGFNATLTAVVDTSRIPAAKRHLVLTHLRSSIAHDRGVALTAAPVPNGDGSLVVVGVVPKTGPDEQATVDLVHRLRHLSPSVTRAGGTLYIAGATAAAIDVSAKLSAALPLFVAIIVVLAVALLTIAFRSLLVPVKAVLGFLVSIAVSVGATVWVFQNGHLNHLFAVAAPGPVTSFLPVLLIGVLFGLAMDYEVFLVSRMRESYEHTADATGAVLDGVARSGRVVTAAALIMAAVFGGFIFNADPIVKSIGFALAVGVLVDAFLVRMTLVPAAMVLLGRRAWWLPGWLDRVIPQLDIEGTSVSGPTDSDRGEARVDAVAPGNDLARPKS
ncbi:MMPL family transporter [Streptomyces sp. NPDC093228]|uniref:MMPL family transporter n=1 Tax=Streptomyces sp. NPDC093228 TaxID=3155070 RepID=UPI0034347871